MSRFETNRQARNAPFKAYWVHHLRSLLGSLGDLSRQLLSSLMTIAVIAIALALPTTMYAAINNLSQVSIGWDNSAQISLFLKQEVTEKQAQQLMAKLKLYDDIEQAKLIPREQALKEFQKTSGFGDAIEQLGKNPLPHVIELKPVIDKNRPDKINHLIRQLGLLKQVDIAQLDLQWVKRLYAMLEIAQKAIWLIAILLGMAVLLVVGNTIRLDIQNRQEEIKVIKLIGATNAFIRRPFLYTGFWYGLSGGLLAWVLSAFSVALLANSVDRLAVLYTSDFQLSGLSLAEAMVLVGFSCFLGLAGSWLAVSRQLHDIEPS